MPRARTPDVRAGPRLSNFAKHRDLTAFERGIPNGRHAHLVGDTSLRHLLDLLRESLGRNVYIQANPSCSESKTYSLLSVWTNKRQQKLVQFQAGIVSPSSRRGKSSLGVDFQPEGGFTKISIHSIRDTRTCNHQHTVEILC